MATKSNNITITVSVCMGDDTRQQEHVIEGETRSKSFSACRRFIATMGDKLTAQGFELTPISRVDFTATHPNGARVAVTARWDERKSRLTTTRPSYTVKGQMPDTSHLIAA